MVDTDAALLAALLLFIDDAVAARDRLRRDDSVVRLLPRAEDFARTLASLPAAVAADSAAIDAAMANDYLVREPAEGREVRSAGRVLSSEALTATGVAGLLLAEREVNRSVLGSELAGYLAGPAVPIWEYAILDADVTLSGPVPVVDGWELVTPTAEELADLLGVPSAAQHVGLLSFDLDLHEGLAMLRRVDSDGKPHSGLVIYWNLRPRNALWLPLLALSLYQNPVLDLWAQYDVEPARRVDRVFDRVYTEPWSPDGVVELERVRRGDYEIDTDGEARFRRFLGALAPLLAGAMAQPSKQTKGSRERIARLRRIVEHFLTAGEDAHGEGEVLSEYNADAVLHYVIALEAVLAGGESDRTELTRKVVQRAAVLVGTDDADRCAVAATVRAAYGARSAYAHGSEPDDVELPALRRVVRDCMLARLIVGDPASDGLTLGALADAGLLDHALLAEQIRSPIALFWSSIEND